MAMYKMPPFKWCEEALDIDDEDIVIDQTTVLCPCTPLDNHIYVLGSSIFSQGCKVMNAITGERMKVTDVSLNRIDVIRGIDGSGCFAIHHGHTIINLGADNG